MPRFVAHHLPPDRRDQQEASERRETRRLKLSDVPVREEQTDARFAGCQHHLWVTAVIAGLGHWSPTWVTAVATCRAGRLQRLARDHTWCRHLVDASKSTLLPPPASREKTW